MSDPVGKLGSFYDFAGLAQLRASASKGAAADDSAVSEVAAEFESAFFQLVFKAMKQAGEPLRSELLQSEAMDFFDDLMLTEVSHFVSKRQSLGVGKWLDETLARQSGGDASGREQKTP